MHGTYHILRDGRTKCLDMRYDHISSSTVSTLSRVSVSSASLSSYPSPTPAMPGSERRSDVRRRHARRRADTPGPPPPSSLPPLGLGAVVPASAAAAAAAAAGADVADVEEHARQYEAVAGPAAGMKAGDVRRLSPAKPRARSPSPLSKRTLR